MLGSVLLQHHVRLCVIQHEDRCAITIIIGKDVYRIEGACVQLFISRINEQVFIESMSKCVYVLCTLKWQTLSLRGLQSSTIATRLLENNLSIIHTSPPSKNR